MSLPELQQNPLVRWFQPHLDPIPSDFRRVIDIFDDDGNGEVDFKEFIMGLSHFRFFTTTAMMDENVKQHIGFNLPPTRCPIEDASLLVSTKPAISPPRQSLKPYCHLWVDIMNHFSLFVLKEYFLRSAKGDIENKLRFAFRCDFENILIFVTEIY